MGKKGSDRSVNQGFLIEKTQAMSTVGDRRAYKTSEKKTSINTAHNLPMHQG